MGEVAVRAAGDDGGVESGEFGQTIAEGDDFRRANEGEVERVKEEDHPLAAEILQRDVLKIAVDDRLTTRWWEDWIAGDVLIMWFS